MHCRGTGRSKGWRGEHTSSSPQAADANILIMASIFGAPVLGQALYEVLGHRDNRRDTAPGHMESRDGPGTQIIREVL